jgi:hypothetical protein
VTRTAPAGRLAFALAATAALLAGTPARAAAPGPLPVALSIRGGRLVASLDLTAAFPQAMERQLGNGLTNVVAVYLALRSEDRGEAEAFYARVFDILFDVWDETYDVTVKDTGAPAGRRMVLRDFPALRALLVAERDIDLGPAAALPERFVVEARVEVNPISRELLQRTREFIANPVSGPRPGGGGRSVLGAMASFLLREPDPGSDVHLFRSQSFAAAAVGGR